MEVVEFSGQLDQAPRVLPFSGELDAPPKGVVVPFDGPLDAENSKKPRGAPTDRGPADDSDPMLRVTPSTSSTAQPTFAVSRNTSGSVLDVDQSGPGEFDPAVGERLSIRANSQQAESIPRRSKETYLSEGGKPAARNTLRAGADVALGAYSGAVGLAKGVFDNINAGDNPVSNVLDMVQSGAKSLQSDDLRDQQVKRDARILMAQRNGGELAAARAAYQSLFDLPAAGMDVIAQGAGSLLPILAMGAAGAGPEIIAAINAASNAGQGASDTAKTLKALPATVWAESPAYQELVRQGASHEQAVSLLAPVMSVPAQLTGAITGYISGRTGVERTIAKGVKPAGNKVGDRAARAVEELFGEQVETAGPQVAGNLAVGALDGKTSATQGLGQAAVDTLAGTIPGAGMAARRVHAPAQTVPTAGDLVRQRWGDNFTQAKPDPIAAIQSASNVDEAIAAAVAAVSAAGAESSINAHVESDNVSTGTEVQSPIARPNPVVGGNASASVLAGGERTDAAPAGLPAGDAASAGPADAVNDSSNSGPSPEFAALVGRIAEIEAQGEVGMPEPADPDQSAAARNRPPTLQARLNDSGTLTIRGDEQTIRSLLQQAGISQAIRSRDGFLVGVSQAQRAATAVQDFTGTARPAAPQQVAPMPAIAKPGPVAVAPAPAPAPEVRPRATEVRLVAQPPQDSPLTIPGDPKAVLEFLEQNGITLAIPMKDGVKVGRSQAQQARQLMETLRAGDADSAAATWFGRRGDGYVTEGDARMALPGRQKVEPSLQWRVEPMPSGKFRLAGYAEQTVGPELRQSAADLPPTPPKSEGVANKPETISAFPATKESAESGTADGLSKMLGKAAKRMAMESEGQGILDDMEEGGESPRDVAEPAAQKALPAAPEQPTAPAEQQAEAKAAPEAATAPAPAKPAPDTKAQIIELRKRKSVLESLRLCQSGLTSCLKKAGSALPAKDKAAILSKASAYRKDGMSAKEAGIKAVDDVLADVNAELVPLVRESLKPKAPEQAAQREQPAAPAKITDIGEKIGGARKDTAESGFTRGGKKESDDRPTWAKRFQIGQIVRPGGQINAPRDEGRWVIRDSRNTDFMDQPKQVGSTFASKEEAEAFLPIAAVGLKHRPVPVSNGKYEIWREITDRKRVKVVDQVFATREDALRYMTQHAVEILETNTTFGEADLPQPPDRKRTGPERRKGNVVGEDFKDTFGFRGVEFGNWNNQDERQALMNDAYDGLLDLSDVMGVPPKAIGLNGDLALAFGARGHGLNSARAHYELERAVINLTKEKGAGSLAHEWFHALDYYFGRQDGKASSEWVRKADGTRTLKVKDESAAASHGFGYKSQVREEVRKAYESMLQTMFKKGATYVEDTEKADKFTARAKDDLAKELDKLRKELSEQKNPEYYKRNNKPATAEQLAEFDAIAKRMIDGEVPALATDWRSIPGSKAAIASRWTNDSLEQIGAIYKAVRGRSGFDSTNRKGWLDDIRGYMKRYSERLHLLADAQSGAEKTKMVPTEFAMNAKELDQGRGGDYWTSPHEMAARAFQGYVEDKMAEHGGMSRFLNYAPANLGVLTPWGVKFPFPRGDERTAINKALDTFVKALDTKETDAGVAMFKRGDKGPGIGAESVRQTLAEPLSKLAIPHNIHDTVADARDELGIDIPDGAKGMHYKGEIHLFADGIRSPLEAEQVFWHEVQHAGLIETTGRGKEYEGALRDLSMKNRNIREAAKAWMTKFGEADYRDRVDSAIEAAEKRGQAVGPAERKRIEERAMVRTKLQAVDEALAELSGSNAKINGIAKFIAKVQEVMRSLGLKRLANALEGKTDAEALAMILRSRDAVMGDRAKGEGELSPSFSRSSPGNVWSVPEPTKTDKLLYETQDGRIDLKRAQEAIKAAGREIEERFDPRLAETLYPGRVAYRSQQFLKGEVRALLEPIALNKVTIDEISDYLIARHAPERNAQVAKVNPDMPDGGAGRNSKGELMTTKTAEQYIADLDPQRRKVLENVAAKVDKITAGTRQLLVDEGLEKPEVVKAWESAYQNYAPLYKDEAQAGTPHPIGTGFNVKGQSSKRATGSTKRVTDVLGHVLMQREAAITRAEKNRVALALYGMALSHPNREFWTTIKPSMSEGAIATELEAMGVPEDAREGMDAAPTITTVDSATGQVVERPNPLYKNLPGAITVKLAGEDRVIMLNANNERAARLAENLKNLDGLTKLDLAGSIVGQATRWIASVNTRFNVAFGFVNAIRDLQSGIVNLTNTPLHSRKAKVFGNVPAAIVGIARDIRGDSKRTEWSDLYVQFQKDGGQTGYRDMFHDAADRTRAIEKELAALESAGKLTPGKAVHAVLDLLGDFNDAIENGIRLSAYKAGLDDGLSGAAAARIARELTVDFNRRGRAGRELSPLYAFLNASIQGTARTIATLKGPSGAKIIAAGLGLGVLQALLLAAAGFEDDDIPEWVKARNLIIPTSWRSKEKRYIAIPLGLGLNVLPNTGRVLAELALYGGKDMGKRLVNAVGEIAGAINPMGGGNVLTPDGALRTIAPTVLDPLIELGFNKSFSGNQIERRPFNEEGDNRPGYARARESTLRTATGQVYLAISKAINSLAGGTKFEAGAVSPTPERVRYLTETVGGGALREFEKAVNASVNGANGQPVRATALPLAGRFVGAVDENAVEQSRYFESKHQIDKAQSSLRAAEKAGDATEYRKILKANPEVKVYSDLQATQKSIRELNRMAVETIDNPAQMQRIDAQRAEEMRKLNSLLKRMEKAEPTLADRLKGDDEAKP